MNITIELTTREAWAIAALIKGRKNLATAHAKIVDAAHAAEVIEFDCAIRPGATRCKSQCETCRCVTTLN